MTVPPVEGSDSEQPIVSVVAPGPARGVTVRRPRGGGQLVRDQGGPAARPWQATGSIDVEQLAVWAYRDQRVDRTPFAGMHTIEVEASGGLRSSWSSDGCAALAQIAHMGCRVETYGSIVHHDIHPVAEEVAAVLDGIEHGGRVAYFARNAGRPEGWQMPDRFYRAVDWVEPWVEAAPVTYRGKPIYCEIIRTASSEEVGRRRDEYEAWWCALDMLAWRLSMRALGFVVLPPSAPRRPWSVEATA